MAKYQYFVAHNLQFYWPDLDNWQSDQRKPDEKLWIGILHRAWCDLTWSNELGENEMRYLKEAYEFITVDNPVFRTCCDVMGFFDDQIEKLRQFAEDTFKSNYVEPTVKEWRRRGRKPRGYIDAQT
jgi:hypothetical protein